MPWDEMMRALADIGYDGGIVMEPFVKPGGQMNDKLVGAASKDAIKAKIDALL